MLQLDSDKIPNVPSHIHLDRKYTIYPILGIVATVIGTSSALILIPEDPYPAGALFSSAVAMTIGIAFAPALATFRNAQTALRAEHIIVLSPIYWLLLDLLQSAYALESVTKEGINGGFIAIGLFVCSIWGASLLRPWSLPKSLKSAASHAITTKTLFNLILVFFTLGIFKYAYPCDFNPQTMISYALQNRWAGPWARGQLGGWDAFLDHAGYFGYLLPTLTVLLTSKIGWFKPKAIISIILTLIMALFLAQGGGRRVIGVIFGAAIICWTIDQRQLNIRRVIAVMLSIGTLLFSMQSILEYRNTGFEGAFYEDKPTSHYSYLHVDDNFLRLSQIIDIIPQYSPYVYEKQIFFTLVRPIPRVFWADKPIDAGFDLPSTLGKSGVSLSSSVIGEWYISMGWLAVCFGGWFYGSLARMASTLLIRDLESSGRLVYSLMLMILFAGVRSMQDLIIMSYSLLAWMLISKIVLPKVNHSSSR